MTFFHDLPSIHQRILIEDREEKVMLTTGGGLVHFDWEDPSSSSETP
ncbi:hypothetical protein ABT282_08115 [Streptomyces sp. NPDC000927]